MSRLGEYLSSSNEQLNNAIEKAGQLNAWFTKEFTELAIKNIAAEFLNKQKLEAWANQYSIPQQTENIKKVGIVMAGNIPLVGFHDLLCTFISGHKAVVKLSSKDEEMMKHIAAVLISFGAEVSSYIQFADMLKGCDAYIATGSNNSGRYFDYYFAKYPHIIRRNKTSVAILDGNETAEELALLADDMLQYFGLGCRNVTQLYVPKDYDFIQLLTALKKYDYFPDHHKYKNNFDYQLALLIMNNKFYMNSGAVLFTENESAFSPISEVHYSFYESKDDTIKKINSSADVQCIVGREFTPFGKAQSPSLTDYADGVDTMKFLTRL